MSDLGHTPKDGVGSDEHVGVHHHAPVAARVVDCAVGTVSLRPGCRLVDQQQPRVAPGPVERTNGLAVDRPGERFTADGHHVVMLDEHRDGAVARAVVDDDHLEARVLHRQHAGDRSENRHLLVEARHDHRDAGQVVAGRNPRHRFMTCRRAGRGEHGDAASPPDRKAREVHDAEPEVGPHHRGQRAPESTAHPQVMRSGERSDG